MAEKKLIRRGTFVLCLRNDGYGASLERGKVYRMLPPEKGDPKSMVRIIDESGEDYLFPADRFVAVKLPPKARRALVTAVP